MGYNAKMLKGNSYSVAMGQIPHSTECISSLLWTTTTSHLFCLLLAVFLQVLLQMPQTSQSTITSSLHQQDTEQSNEQIRVCVFFDNVYIDL